MKKLLSLAALAAVSMSVCAQDLDDPESTDVRASLGGISYARGQFERSIGIAR